MAETDEEKFERFCARWTEETKLYSSTWQIESNPNFLRMVGMGERAIRPALKHMQRVPDHAFRVLRYVIDEDPIPRDHYGYVSVIVQDWIRWGIANGYVEG